MQRYKKGDFFAKFEVETIDRIHYYGLVWKDFQVRVSEDYESGFYKTSVFKSEEELYGFLAEIMLNKDFVISQLIERHKAALGKSIEKIRITARVKKETSKFIPLCEIRFKTNFKGENVI